MTSMPMILLCMFKCSLCLFDGNLGELYFFKFKFERNWLMVFEDLRVRREQLVKLFSL